MSSSNNTTTDDVRNAEAEKRRIMLQDIIRQAIGQLIEPTTYRIPGIGTISFVNVTTAIVTSLQGTGASGGDVTPPAQVTGLNAVPTGTSTMSLTWNANGESDLAGYNVYRGTAPGFSVTLGVTVPTGTPSTNSFNDSGLSASTTYYYKISARDTTGNLGTLSTEDSATTNSGADVTPPAQVTGLVVS